MNAYAAVEKVVSKHIKNIIFFFVLKVLVSLKSTKLL